MRLRSPVGPAPRSPPGGEVPGSGVGRGRASGGGGGVSGTAGERAPHGDSPCPCWPRGSAGGVVTGAVVVWVRRGRPAWGCRSRNGGVGRGGGAVGPGDVAAVVLPTDPSGSPSLCLRRRQAAAYERRHARHPQLGRTVAQRAAGSPVGVDRLGLFDRDRERRLADDRAADRRLRSAVHRAVAAPADAGRHRVPARRLVGVRAVGRRPRRPRHALVAPSDVAVAEVVGDAAAWPWPRPR